MGVDGQRTGLRQSLKGESRYCVKMWSELPTELGIEDCKGEMAGVVGIAERIDLIGVNPKGTVSNTCAEMMLRS